MITNVQNVFDLAEGFLFVCIGRLIKYTQLSEDLHCQCVNVLVKTVTLVHFLLAFNPACLVCMYVCVRAHACVCDAVIFAFKSRWFSSSMFLDTPTSLMLQ